MGTFSTPPRYPTTSFLNLCFPPFTLFQSQRLSILPPNFITIIETSSLENNKELINILLESQHLTSLFNDSTTDLHVPTILRMIAAIEYHILSFFHSPDFKYGGAVQELLSMGLLLYLITLKDDACARIWGSPPSHDNNTIPTTLLILKLKSCLETADKSSHQMRGLFLWAILMGGVAVAGTRDRAWFVAKLVKVVMEWGIGSWEEVRGGFWCVEGCREVWDEGMVTMAVLFKL
jgi:hypothetical protein